MCVLQIIQTALLEKFRARCCFCYWKFIQATATQTVEAKDYVLMALNVPYVCNFMNLYSASKKRANCIFQIAPQNIGRF